MLVADNASRPMREAIFDVSEQQSRAGLSQHVFHSADVMSFLTTDKGGYAEF